MMMALYTLHNWGSKLNKTGELIYLNARITPSCNITSYSLDVIKMPQHIG